MSETRTRVPNDRFGAPFGREGDIMPPETSEVPALAQPRGGTAVDEAMAQIVVAQRVPIKRDMTRILSDVSQAAAVAFDDWFYKWPTKNKDGSTGTVKGPTIKCAMAVANMWGNCRIEAFPAHETQSHWVFLARFVDYERGVTITRTFQQRKAQGQGGRMEADRAMDIAFQIGQSKAMRNVVVGALGLIIDRAVEEAESSIYGWVEKKPDIADRKITEMAKTVGMADLKRLDRAVGRVRDKWSTADKVDLLSRLRSVQEGMAALDDAFPLPEADGEEPQQAVKSTRPAAAEKAGEARARAALDRTGTATAPADKGGGKSVAPDQQDQRPPTVDNSQAQTAPDQPDGGSIDKPNPPMSELDF